MKLGVWKVLDAEIDRINNHYNSLIEQSKKERDRKIQDCGGLRKYQNLIEQKKKDPDLQYTPGEQTLVTHVGEVIAKCRTKVEKLEEAHQGELKIAEEKRSYKILIRLELEENRQILKKKVVR